MNRIDFETRAWEILNNISTLERLAAADPEGARHVRDWLADASGRLVCLLAKIESGRFRKAG